MPDDPPNDTESGGFDDWLSEAPGKATDPYAELPEDPPDNHLGDQKLFADGQDAEGAVEDADTADPDRDTVVEPEPPQPLPDERAAVEPEPEETDDGDDTGEIPIVLDDELDLDIIAAMAWAASTGPLVEFEAFDGVDEADTGELEIITSGPSGEVDVGEPDATIMYDGGFDLDSVEGAGATAGDDSRQPDDVSSEVPVVGSFGEAEDDQAVPSEGGQRGDSGGVIAPGVASAVTADDTHVEDFDPLEDTGEAVFVAGDLTGAGAVAAGFGALSDRDPDEESPDAEALPSGDRDAFTLDEEEMLLGATQEHIGLAAAMAAAENEDTEQVALVAEIPGLESSVVGFEDVVEAEGHRRVRARPSGDLIARVVTGVILILALGASLIWRPALIVFAIAVFVLGAGEFYTALVRTARKPIALFGFIGIVGASMGAFLWGAVAIPIAFVLATVLLLLFYAVVPGKSDPMANLALTTTVMVWAGLGSFAMLIARSDDYQVLVLGVVIAVAATDISAFFIGRSLGRTHFAPWVSPKKTVEGLVAGTVVAFGVGAMLHFFPPFELTSGLAIGAAAALLTPIGDLAMSAAKRSLGLKDMGSVLPGHGGFLDRIDGLLLVIPAAWAIFVWAGLL